ncbi:MAG: hypothetical protein EAZ92_10690 [Candidatus Kapaibacterium sp.]|nr:MAG: hypothetical protein EAZ92_10690 [Candidatus Kapabacteria bacterium]
MLFTHHFLRRSRWEYSSSRSLRSLLFCCVLGVFVCVSCNEPAEEKPIHAVSETRSIPFTVPSELASRKIDTRRADIGNDGFEDALVTIYPKDSLGARIGFETLRIYEYDSTKKQFWQAFEGTYYYGTMLDLRDLDRDGTNEICIRTDGGGNSATASIGMTVLKKRAGKYTIAAGFDVGNPDFITLPDSTLALLAYDEYYPEYLAPNEVVSVPDSLVVFATQPERAQNLRLRYFADAADKAQTRYKERQNALKANRTQQNLFEVYSSALVTVRLLAKGSDAQAVSNFMTKERPYWRAMLPKPLHDALDDVFRTHP